MKMLWLPVYHFYFLGTSFHSVDMMSNTFLTINNLENHVLICWFIFDLLLYFYFLAQFLIFLIRFWSTKRFRLISDNPWIFQPDRSQTTKPSFHQSSFLCFVIFHLSTCEPVIPEVMFNFASFLIFIHTR